MSHARDWVFTRVALPRPLEADQVEAMLLRLAADRAAPPLVFEARSDHRREVTFLLGTPAEHVRWVQRTVRGLVPGIALTGANPGDRKPVTRVARVRQRPRRLALRADASELVATGLLIALTTRLAPGEQVVVQVLLGPRVPARHLPRELANPVQPWWSQMLTGTEEAPKKVREHVDVRSGQAGFAAAVRIGVSAATRSHGRQLILGVLGALSVAEDRHVYLDLIRESSRHLNDASTPRWWWPLHLAAAELVGLLAWPLGDGDLPGVPGVHPKALAVPPVVSRDERVFGVADHQPGRRVGLSAADSLTHFLALGPTGSGKSTALLHLIAADISVGRSVVVIDPKRQLIDDVIERAVPRERAGDVVIIDPSERRPSGFNPLDVRGRDADVAVDGLVSTFAAVFADGWGPRTQDIINSGLLTLARASTAAAVPYTLLDLPRLLTDDAFRRPIIGSLADDPGLGPFWAWFTSLTPQAQAQALAAPLNKLRRIMLRPGLRAVLGQAQPQFRLRDVFREPKVVLVPLNEGLIGGVSAQLLGSLVVAEVWNATLERASETRPAARPASIYVDELQKYLNLPTSVGDALAQSRSLGVAWHLAHQYRGQLPVDLQAAIDSNARSKLIFRPDDPKDATALARQAPELESSDFMALGRFHAYANLAVDGAPAGWCSVRTLPPPATTGVGASVRAAAALYGGMTNEAEPEPHERPDLGTRAVGRKRSTS